MIAGYLYSTLTQQRHALQGSTGLQALPVHRAGHLLRWLLVAQRADAGDEDLAHPTVRLAPAARRARRVHSPATLASWLWFLPALASAHFSGIRSTSAFAVDRRGRRAGLRTARPAAHRPPVLARRAVRHATRRLTGSVQPAPGTIGVMTHPQKVRGGLERIVQRHRLLDRRSAARPGGTKAPFARNVWLAAGAVAGRVLARTKLDRGARCWSAR